MPYDIIIGRNESDKKEFGNRGLIYIGKGYVKMGQYTSLSNRILLDVVRTHVVLIAGKRGSGKSYTIGVLAEQLSDLPKEVSQNIASIIFDTMGIYWTMKYKNEKDKELLHKEGLKPKNLPILRGPSDYNGFIIRGQEDIFNIGEGGSTNTLLTEKIYKSPLIREMRNYSI